MIDTWDGRVISASPAVRMAVRNFLSVASLAVLLFAAMLSSAPPANAQSVTTAFNLNTQFPGYEIDAIAVNTETNKIYIATQNISGAANSGRIFVLDGSTDQVLTSFSDTSSDADQPFAIAINPVTNTIYVANTGGGASGGSVTVINGATDSIVTTMSDGNSIAPQALVVNPLTNIIYVANNSSSNVTMYSGATNTSLGTFGVGTGPVALALNTAVSPALLYVVNSGVVGGNTVNNGSIQVVDTTHTNTPTTVTDPNATNPIAVAVDVVSGLAYVAENTPASVTVINGSTFMTNIKDTGAASTPRSVAVNPLTHRVYVADVGGGSGTVSIFQGTTYQATITMTDGPNVVAVDTSTDIAYAVDDAGQIAVINGATGTAFSPFLQTSAGLEVVAVNPVTHRAYVAIDNQGNEVTMAIVDGATNASASIGVESEPWAVVVNPVTNMIYVANFDDDDVSVINGATNQVVSVSTGEGPDALVVDPVNNLIYVANFDSSSLTVINGATNGTASISFSTTPITPDSLAINPVLNEVYGASSGSNLGFSFSSSFASQSVFDGGFVFGGGTPLATATNPATGMHFTLLKTGGPFLAVDDLTAPIGFYYRPCFSSAPISMDVNPTANSIFIPCSDGTINVLQGVDVFGDGPATVIPVPSGYTGPYSAVAANPITNMAYVADSGNSNLYVINGANNTVTATVEVGSNPTSIAVNIASNKIYVLSVASGGTPSLTIVDGLTNTVLGTIPVGTAGQVAARNYEVAANPATGNIYGLTLAPTMAAKVITENTPAIACNPSACLTTTILTFDNNTVFTSLPTFSFTAQNHLTGSTPITGVYFQVDTWQGVWNPTKLSGGVYVPQFPLAAPIPPGFHMLYAFATSGDDASTSSFVGLQSSPLVGPIASYGFLVAPPIAGTQSNLFFGTVAVGASGGTQTAYLANNGEATLSYSYTITGPNANDFVPNGSGNQPCDNSGQVLAVSYCALSIDFVPSTVNSESAVLSWTDNSLATGSNVTQVVNLSGNGANVTAPTILTGPSDPTSSTSATFTFNDSDPGVTSFTCQLDGDPAASCVSGVTYTGLEAISHTFTVFGTASGVNSPTSTYNWTITGSSFSPFNLTLVGFGTGMVSGDNNIFCQEAGGVTSGNCSTDVTGASENLTATPGIDGSTFGGWGGAAASCGMSLTCAVPVVGQSTNAIASFVSGPATINVSFTPSTTPQTQEAIFDCPTNDNPCTSPNAHALALTVQGVSTGFTMSVIANEVSPFQANGDCASGNNVTNDFDCRFVSFFTFGPDGGGGEVVPLCDAYSNGNCIFYSVVYCVPQATGPCVPTHGAEPPASFYQSPVNWLITWNNDATVPPAPYQPIPRLYDDPDSQVNNTDPFGTSCTTAMQINGSPTSPAIFCQFVYDITTNFIPGQKVDSGIGGTTRQFNDVVVAFPVTLSPAFLNVADSGTVDALGNIGFTDTVTAPATNPITNVTLRDPLPAGPGPAVTWTISPAYAGPGTCTLSGAVGSQVLNCSFGNFAASMGATVHVSAANAPAGQYLNAATVTSNNGSTQNQTLLSISTITVQSAPSAFSGLSGSQSAAFGVPVTLSGVVSANDPVFPPPGVEVVTVTIDGIVQNATIGANGVFATTFKNIPASTTPYVITYHYAGDANFAPATNSSTTLTVTKANSTTTITSNTPNPSTTAQVVTVAFKVTGATVPTGSVTVTAKLSATTVTCSGALSSGAGSCTFTLTTPGAWTLTASYGGDTNYLTSVSTGTTQTVNSPGSTLKFSPASLNFGTVYVGTTEIETTTITNTGSSMVTFSSFSIASISGDDSSGFLGITFCPKTLNPGRSCTIFMSFTADSNVTKTHAANLVVVDNGAGSPQMVLMTATVINPVASLSPSSLSFGNQKTNTTSAAKTITLTNTGTTQLTLNTVSISGNFALASGTTCAHGTALAPNGKCLINVTFKPTSKGSKSGTVTVTDNALRGTSTVSLSGAGN